MICFGLASVVAAVEIERVRRASSILPIGSKCSPEGVQMSRIAAGWMAVPYFLMGVAEIYGLVTLLHYAYVNCPASMRTLSSASFFFIQAVASAIFAVETGALKGYIPDNLNDGHLEYGYLLNLA